MTVMQNARKMTDDMFELGRKAWLAGLGAVAVAEEETRGAFDQLVTKGEKFSKSDKNLMGKALHEVGTRARGMGRKVEEVVQETVGTTLNMAGIPSRYDIRTLVNRVEQLNRKVDSLKKKR